MEVSNSSATDPTFLLYVVGIGKIKPEVCFMIFRAARMRLPKSHRSLLLAYVRSKQLYPSFSRGSSTGEVAHEHPIDTCATWLDLKDTSSENG